MAMITWTRRERAEVRGVTGVQIADFRLELRYLGFDHLYQLVVIDTITKISTKKSPKLRSF